MKIEILIKYAKTKKNPFEQTKETKDERKERLKQEEIDRIIGKESDEDELDFKPENKFMEMFDPKNLEFFYQPYVIDLKNVEEFFPYDEQHTMLVTTYSGNLPAKISWANWKQLWAEKVGEHIIQVIEKPTE